MSKIRNFFWGEIVKSRSLEVAGALLAGTIFLSFYLWQMDGFAEKVFSREAICWSFFPQCGDYRIFLSHNYHNILWAMGAVSAASVFLFGFRFSRSAWASLLIAFALKLVVFFSDYEFMGNFHYMSHILLLAFLFLPQKKSILVGLIVLFYVAAAVLKFNSEWLTGAAFIREPVVGGVLLQVLCAYVIVLELFFVWGLLSRKKGFFYLTWAQLFLFHAFSWHIVSYFYPMTMFLLIGIPLALELKNDRPVLSCLRSKFVIGVLTLFGMAQIPPWVTPGHSSRTTEGRLWALNMLDARVECSTVLYIESVDKFERIRFDNLGYRLRCDPWVSIQAAQRQCSEDIQQRVSMLMHSKRSTDSHWHKLIDSENVCEHLHGFVFEHPMIFEQRGPKQRLFEWQGLRKKSVSEAPMVFEEQAFVVSKDSQVRDLGYQIESFYLDKSRGRLWLIGLDLLQAQSNEASALLWVLDGETLEPTQRPRFLGSHGKFKLKSDDKKTLRVEAGHVILEYDLERTQELGD